MMKRRFRSLVYASSGHLYEHYNGSLFNFATPFLGPIFFPNEQWTYWAVAAGFMMQPFGALIFSWVGDHIGRRPAIIYAFFLSTIPTIVLGLLPSYLEWGLWSSLLLIMCRIVQGASIGGAFYGTVTFVSETSTPHARNLNMGLLLPTGFIGVILGMLLFRFVLQWWPENGWRIPFLLGGLLGIILYSIRNFMVESEVWESSVFLQQEKFPLLAVLRKYPANVIAVLCAGMGGLVPFYLAASWLPDILVKKYGLDNSAILDISMGMMVLGGALVFFACWVSTFWNLRKMLRIYILAWIPLGVLLYIGLSQENLSLIIIAQLLIAANTGLCSSYFLFIQKLFPPQYAYSGFAVPYACGQALLTGTTPLLARAIEQVTGKSESACGLIILSTLLMAGMLLLGKPYKEQDA